MIRFIALLVVALLLVTPVVVMAQDLTETFTSDDGTLTFMYPSGWVASGFFGFGMIANSQAAMDASSDALTSGQVQISVIAQSTESEDFFLPAGFDASDGFTAQEVLEAALAEGLDQGVEIVSGPSEVDDIDADAAGVVAKQGTQEIYVVVVVPDQTTIILLGASAPVGEASQYVALVNRIANTVKFTPPEPGGSVSGGGGPAAIAGTGNTLWQQQRPSDYSVENFGGLGAVAVSPDGVIYIADGFNGLRVLDADGNVTGTITNTEIDNFDDVAVAPDGTLWTTDSFENKVYHLDTQGEILASFGEAGTNPGQFGEFSPDQLEIDAAGDLYLFNSRTKEDGSSVGSIMVYDAAGTFVREFPTDPDNQGRLASFIQMAVGPDGTIYASDFFGGLTLFTPEGQIVTREFGVETLDFVGVNALAVGGDGSVYVASLGTVYKLDKDGKAVAQYGTEQPQPTDGSAAPEFAAGELYSVSGIGVMPDNTLIIADTNYAFTQVVRVKFE